MSSPNDAAFPTPAEYRPDGELMSWATPGLTKREYMAAVALQGLATGLQWSPGLLIHEHEMADDAVCFADALLKKLAEPQL